MRWSMSLGRVAGVRVNVHYTFVLLLGWVALSFGMHGGWAGAGMGLILVACLAAIIVMHELGHALAARRYGIRTRDITLLPIGGIARLERMPDKPAQELVVALAGPLVNVILAAGIFIGVIAGRGIIGWAGVMGPEGDFIVQLFWINVALAAFNMLPAFPMDGGRVLRALLAMHMDYVKATQVAASIGRAMAVLFAVVGLFGNPILLLIALFVWVGAGAEAEAAVVKAALAGVRVRDAMVTEFHVLGPADPVARAAEHAAHNFQHDFPVVRAGRVIGMVTRAELFAALTSGRPELPADEAMRHDLPCLHPLDTAESAFERFQRCACAALPVVESGRLIGLVTADQIAEHLMLPPRRPETTRPTPEHARQPSHPRRTDLIDETVPV